MLKAVTHHHGCHDRWRIKDNNCDEGRLITIFQSFFVLLWAQFSREALNFLMVETDSKFWKISWKSDKTKAIQMKESNWADSCGGVYLWSPLWLWFPCRCSPADGKKRWGSAWSGWSSGCIQGLIGRECLLSPFTDLLWEWRKGFSLYIYAAAELVFIEFKVNTMHQIVAKQGYN